ncbi:MAG TPA: hypothetical protein VGR22_00505 [Thermomicrobiales bacterium]|nr:hypothetical protein [Thermomicrobiales bacterium]
MVRLLLTHGRGLSGRNQEYLRRKFTRLVQEGLRNVGYDDLTSEQVDFLYYGDLLDRAEREYLPEPTPLIEIGRREGAEVSRYDFKDDLEHLHRHLGALAVADAGICNIVEERAGQVPIVSEASDEASRRAAIEIALEDRTAQLLENPNELLDVLERGFGPAYGDDEAVRRHLHELDERLGDDPRLIAARRGHEEEGTDDTNRVEDLLREWILGPVTDAIASLQAVSRIIGDYGIDLRKRLGEWRLAAWSEAQTRFEGTDFGRQWALLFDIIAAVAHLTMLDGVYIARRMADVEIYFRDPSIRNDVRIAFRNAVLGADGATILVAHSLGSVIGYDVLREYERLQVPGLVTVGSPLSIGHFRRNLARKGESGDNLPVPSMLEGWVNVYSEMDPLVLGSGIERWFQGGGDESGSAPVDREAGNTGYLDAHSPDQYLRSKETASAIVRMVTRAMRDVRSSNW